MAGCDHAAWLQVVAGKDLVLRNEGRLARILPMMTNPETQFPALLFFIGRRMKTEALSHLFPENNLRRSHPNGLANLRMDNRTTGTRHPVLFADSDPSPRVPKQLDIPLCHDIVAHPVRWRQPSKHNIYDLVHARIFFNFTDVICIFADDVGGVHGAAALLKEWATIRLANDLVPLPRVIIVTVGDDVSPTFQILNVEDLRFSLLEHGPANLSGSFSGIYLLQLAGESITPLARYRRLKEALLRQADEMRHVRITVHRSFSACHMSSLFDAAVNDTAKLLWMNSDPIMGSRRKNPLDEAFSEHVTNFLQLGIQFKVSYEAMASFIASAIIMDAYPPAMHSRCARPPNWTSITDVSVKGLVPLKFSV